MMNKIYRLYKTFRMIRNKAENTAEYITENEDLNMERVLDAYSFIEDQLETLGSLINELDSERQNSDIEDNALEYLMRVVRESLWNVKPVEVNSNYNSITYKYYNQNRFSNWNDAKERLSIKFTSHKGIKSDFALATTPPESVSAENIRIKAKIDVGNESHEVRYQGLENMDLVSELVEDVTLMRDVNLGIKNRKSHQSIEDKMEKDSVFEKFKEDVNKARRNNNFSFGEFRKNIKNALGQEEQSQEEHDVDINFNHVLDMLGVESEKLSEILRKSRNSDEIKNMDDLEDFLEETFGLSIKKLSKIVNKSKQKDESF